MGSSVAALNGGASGPRRVEGWGFAYRERNLALDSGYVSDRTRDFQGPGCYDEIDPRWIERDVRIDGRPIGATRVVSAIVGIDWTIRMDRLWAPWRAQYVLESADRTTPDESCFICRGLELDDDRANLVVWRGERSVIFLNRFPYNNGHLLVAPRVHKGSLAELDDAELADPIRTLRRVVGVLDRMIRPQGYNIGLNLGRSAGAGLPGHLHWHVVPRWDGDTNFMPILGGAKVIVESLTDFYDRLVEGLDGQPLA